MRPSSFDFHEGPSSGPLTATHELSSVSEHLRVLIPMAGDGRRFFEAGFKMPKPLIHIQGVAMIERVVQNLGLPGQYIFIVRQEHEERYQISKLLSQLRPGCQIIFTDVLTQGAACSTLLANAQIDNEHPLVIANSDQLVDWDADDFLQAMSHADGGILTFEANDPKWSYALVDENSRVAYVAEKRVISHTATVGIYYFRHGSEYVRYAERMIAKDIRINNEFYVAPVFNEYIQDGKTVLAYPCRKMTGLGTPEDVRAFR